jgi:aminopeptidase N
MPGTNLTHDEALARAAIIDPSSLSYTVELDLNRGETTFGSTTTVRFTTHEEASTWLDLIAPTVHSVVLNGTPLDPAEVFDGSRLALANVARENEVKVVADASFMRTGEGLHRFVDPVDGHVYVYSQFQVADARRVFACFDQPDLKATYRFVINAPADWQVISNAPGKAGKERGGSRQWTFDTTPLLSTYITAIVAGPYHVARSEYVGKDKTVPMGLYCRASLAAHMDADELFDITRRGFAFFEEIFGRRYPFAKYDQVFVPEFNAGAMENAGAVTFHEDMLFRSRVTDASFERRAETILHEMAHMWFGDLVTMRWWDDLWLNESFATWASVLALTEATRWTQAWTTFAVSEKLWALRQDQLPSTHPVSATIRDLEDVEVNFDGITYAKGASVLTQLVAWVGRDAFLDGLRRYFAEHAWGNTELADLFTQLEQTSGRDLSEWNLQWLRAAGVNTLRPVLTVNSKGEYTSVILEQTASPEHPTIRSHRLAIGLYDRGDDGKLVRRRRVELDVSGARTEVTDLRGERQPDVLLVNDDDLTFAKVRLDDHSQRTVITSIGQFDPLQRALCWTSTTDMLRDAEMSATAYVELVLGGIARETSLTVVQHVLRSARAAIDLYAWPANRTALSARWASALRHVADAAEPGSDRQLAFTRAWVGAVASNDHIREIRALLAGADDVLPGLVVDTDLRWTLLQRLVVIGAADEDEITAELERDNTATGQREAAYARAALPAPAAKVAAWQSAVESDTVPNAILKATVSGFGQPEQRELIRPFVEPYLEAVTKVWGQRTNESAQTIVVGLFPRVLADAATAQSVRSWLDKTDAPDAARRLVGEGLADVERALRAQERDRLAD